MVSRLLTRLSGRFWGRAGERVNAEGSVALGRTRRTAPVLMIGSLLLVPALMLALTLGGGDDARSRWDGNGAQLAAPAALGLSAGVLDAATRGGPPPVTDDPAPGETVIAAPPAFDAPAELPAPPPSVLRSAGAPPGPGVWAVMIGIDDYPGSGHDLRSAVADARDVDAALARYGVPGDHRLMLTNRQASAATVGAALDWLVARAGPGSTAVVFYAGHVRKLDGRTEAIVGADGRLVPDSEVAARLSGLQASRAWIAIAACYGGGFTEVMAPGRILTAAAGPNSLAYENAAYGRSYLVEYMVRRAMLQGRADRSVEAAFAWAAAELRRDHPNRVPVMDDRADGEAVLGRPPAQPQPQPAPPPKQEPREESPPPPAPKPEDSDAQQPCAVRVGTLVTCGRPD